MARVVGDSAPAGSWPSERFSIGSRPDRRELLILAAILAVFVLMAGLLVLKGGPLGHDESVYSLRAESFRLGEPASNTWAAYRAPGLPFLLQLAWLGGPSEVGLRSVTVIFGVLLVAGTWLLGRAVFGSRPGLIAAAGVATTPLIVASSIQVWPDVPGAALGVLAIGVLVFATSGDRASWWILLVVPLVAAATVVRFGAPLQLAIGLGAVGIWRWRVLVRSLPAAGVTAAASVTAVAIILLVPRATGSEAAPLRATAERTTRMFEGFVDYALEAGILVGSVSGLLLGIGLLIAAVSAMRDPRRRGAVVMMAGAGLGTFLATAISLHGELRYLSPTMPLLWVAAGFGLAGTSRFVQLPQFFATAAAAALAIALLVTALDFGQATNRFNTWNYGHIEEAARWTTTGAGDRSCGLQTGHTPQADWYSDCIVTGYPGTGSVEVRPGLAASTDVVFVFRVQNGKRQPGAAAWDAFGQEPVASIDGGEVLIYEVTSGS